MPKCGYMTD